MADEMHVEISGEGDFTVETDSAWTVSVKLGGEAIQIDAPYMGETGLKVTAWDGTYWRPIWPVPK